MPHKLVLSFLSVSMLFMSTAAFAGSRFQTASVGCLIQVRPGYTGLTADQRFDLLDQVQLLLNNPIIADRDMHIFDQLDQKVTLDAQFIKKVNNEFCINIDEKLAPKETDEGFLLSNIEMQKEGISGAYWP